MSVQEAIRQELVRLRRNRGVLTVRLKHRLGPYLRTACNIYPDDSDEVARQKVRSVFRQVAAGFQPDLRSAAEAAFALDNRVAYTTLRAREDHVVGQGMSERTVRRRVDDACDLLAAVLAQRAVQRRPSDPEQGWYVRRVSALLCLDTTSPELYEDRTIVSTSPDLTEICTRFSLPRQPATGSQPLQLEAKVLHGAHLRRAEPFQGVHFRHTLTLPRTLQPGESLSYAIVYRIPAGQPMRPHFAFVPYAPCELFQVRVRFDRGRLPREVWRLDRVPHRLLDEQPTGAEHLTVDDAGDLSQQFTNLSQGYGYGVAWRPAED